MHPISVMVMDNLLGSHFDKISNVYDLKGSTFKRISKSTDKGVVLKDLNFLNNKDDRVKVNP